MVAIVIPPLELSALLPNDGFDAFVFVGVPATKIRKY